MTASIYAFPTTVATPDRLLHVERETGLIAIPDGLHRVRLVTEAVFFEPCQLTRTIATRGKPA